MLLIAFVKLAQYFPESDVGAWLVSIARHVWSKERWTRERQALARCIEKLGKPDHEIIRSHFARSLGYRRIAEEMNKTLSWVKVRMFRARGALRDCIRRAMSGGEVAREA